MCVWCERCVGLWCARRSTSVQDCVNCDDERDREDVLALAVLCVAERVDVGRDDGREAGVRDSQGPRSAERRSSVSKGLHDA